MELPLWLFTGPEIGERNNALLKLKKELTKKYGEPDSHVFYAGDSEMREVISILQNGNLFASSRFAVLKNAELIKKKEDIEAVLNWAKAAGQSGETAFLVLISDEISINKSIESAVPKNHKQIFWEMFENKKHEWIRNFFAKEQLGINNEAAEAILELVENNTEALKTACSHIVLFFDKGSTITAEEIEKLLAHNKEESVFTLFDALTYSDLEGALSIMQKLLLSKNTSPIQIAAGLVYCFRRLYDWHTAHMENPSMDDFALKKIGFTSKTAVSQYRRAAKLWSFSKTEEIIGAISKADFETRVAGIPMQKIIMEQLLCGIAGKTKSKPAIYEKDKHIFCI